MPFIEITSGGTNYLINTNHIVFVEAKDKGCNIHVSPQHKNFDFKVFYLDNNISEIKEMIKTAS